MGDTTPFHTGESCVQTRMGVREVIEPFARRVVRDHLPEQHRDFYRQLPFVVLAARDEDTRPWVTLVAASNGVATSPDPYTLDFAANPAPGDALAGALSAGRDVGVLGIEFQSRRRNRVNGRVDSTSEAGFRLRVEQSFGNCPQYIHSREWIPASAAREPRREASAHLNEQQQAWVGRADTFFIATGFRDMGENPAYGMDASHRGGEAGFVRVLDERTIAWPDYAGNNHFNTVGNLVMDARLGMLFVDFAAGSLLQITGRAQIDWSPDPALWPGAQRVVTMTIDAVRALHEVLPLRWSAEPMLRLEIDEVVDESEAVRSFWLRHADDDVLPPFRAGQHLPLTVQVDGHREMRSYSLSSSPLDPRWRISVKRLADGRVSSHLHDAYVAGSILNAGLPAGDFALDEAAPALLLIGAGIGVTPLLSMLAEGVARGQEVHFVYLARNGRQAALLREVEAAASDAGVRVHRIFSKPEAWERQGQDFDSAGRLNPVLLSSLLPRAEYRAYLCGPGAFVGDVSRWLAAEGLASDRIHSESFGS
jgi:ferredoxin-NADP reductase/predicted pyridoxine 5'-phosphate oxidase superfamily flavin-nucleotide-binding protein